MRKGFTLFELLIVLIFLGSIAGGYVYFQHLHSVSRTQASIMQISQYDIGIHNFPLKYKQFPGCANLAGDPNFPGCVEGYFDQSGYASMMAWSDLSIGMNIKSSGGHDFTFRDPFQISTEENCPSLKLEQDTTNHPCVLIQHFANGDSYNYKNAPAGKASAGHDPLKARDAAELDEKLDDGLAQSGMFTSYAYGHGNAGIGDFAIPCMLKGEFNKYDVKNSGYNCSITFAVGLSNVFKARTN